MYSVAFCATLDCAVTVETGAPAAKSGTLNRTMAVGPSARLCIDGFGISKARAASVEPVGGSKGLVASFLATTFLTVHGRQ